MDSCTNKYNFALVVQELVLSIRSSFVNLIQARIQDFLKGGGGGDGHKGGGVIAPVGEKLLFEHTTFSATRGG